MMPYANYCTSKLTSDGNGCLRPAVKTEPTPPVKWKVLRLHPYWRTTQILLVARAPKLDSTDMAIEVISPILCLANVHCVQRYAWL